MKQIFTSILLWAAACLVGYAQPKARFDKDIHDFGVVLWKHPATATFTIKNDGTFDASVTPYYNSSYSSAFYIVATGTAAKGSRIEGTTAVEEVTVERVADDAIYDLTGRKVTEMRAGEIYIQNGKKILKR